MAAIHAMTRYSYSWILCLLSAVAVQITGAQSTPDRPNVLFITIDDLRPALGCYDDFLAKSPHIDRLAATARVFKRAHCQQAVCGPSRASLLTGRLPENIGVWHNRNLFRRAAPDLVTLPQLFKTEGWQVRGLGKIFSGDTREDDPPSWSVPALLRGKGWKNYALSGRADGKGPASEAADGTKMAAMRCDFTLAPQGHERPHHQQHRQNHRQGHLGPAR